LDERHITFESSGGVLLEGMLYEALEPKLAALIIHPHPQYGGDMDNHIVIAMRDALAAAGATTLRFNLRGTGGSGGSFEPTVAADDAEAALGALTAARPTLPVALAGYSYGAQLAAGLAAAMKPVKALILVSPPLAYAALPSLPASLPILGIGGDADPLCPTGALEALAAANTDVRVVPGMDHGWSFGTNTLSSAIRSFANNIAV
jgi:hypothetical protein